MLSDIYNCEVEDIEDEIVEELWHRLPNWIEKSWIEK